MSLPCSANVTVRGRTNPVPIHSLWKRENFRLTDWDTACSIDDNNPKIMMNYNIYQRIIPALQLVTRLMEQARPALMRIMFAPIRTVLEPDEDLDAFLDENWIPKSSNFLDETWIPNESDHQYYDSVLEDFATEFRVYLMKFSTYGAYALQAGRQAASRQPLPKNALRLAIADEYIKTISSQKWLTTNTTWKRTTLFSLAVSLTHELAHIIWNIREWTEVTKLFLNGGRNFAEPRSSSTEFYTELGHGIEMYLFGGVITLPKDKMKNLYWLGNEGARLVEDPEQEDVEKKINPVWINGLFAPRFWENRVPGRIVPWLVDEGQLSSSLGSVVYHESW